MNEETVVATTPVGQESAEQVQQVEQAKPEATTEQPQEKEVEKAEQPKKTPWFQTRIDSLTREKYEAKRLAESAAEEARQYREQLAQVQQGEQPQQPGGDVRTIIQQEAQRLLAEKTFNDSCNKVYETGKSEFPDFDAALNNLHLVGVNREFLELTATSDAGAKLIHHLGQDLDKASQILSLPPVQMARALTKLELELTKPQTKPVSNAPAPISPIAGTGKTSKEPSEMTDKEFAEWRRGYKKP